MDNPSLTESNNIVVIMQV